MKRTITLTLLIWLSLSHLPTAFAQQPPYRIGDEDEAAPTPRNRRPVVPDDDGDAVQVVKKKKPVHHKVLVGIEAGLSSCYMWRPTAINDPILGGTYGGFLYIPLAGKLYLQPGLYYMAAGGSQTVGTGVLSSLTMTTTYNVNSIELPVNLGFRFGHKKSRYMSFIGMGPYIARNLGGTVTFNDGSTLTDNLVIGSNEGQNFKAFDYGLGLNVSIEWRCGLFLRARYQYGFANLAPHLATMNSMSDGITFGYLFGKKYKPMKKHYKRMTRENDSYNDPRGRPGDTDE